MQINRAIKSKMAATSDIWESRYLVGGAKMKREAKRTSKRAQRRMNKQLIREQA
jgi:hypothetical protein